MMKARFRTANGRVTIVQVYAPTANSTEQEIEEFYSTLQQTMREIPSQDLIVVMGDLNAKIGADWRTWKGAIGKFGYEEENERGERLLNFCLNNDLRVMNTVFYQKKNSRKWTWESPDGKTKNRIDYILVNNRWKSAVSMCRSFSKPDVASDHKLVMAGIRLKMRTVYKEKPGRRFDVEKLEDEAVRKQFNDQLSKRWRQVQGKNTDTVE